MKKVLATLVALAGVFTVGVLYFSVKIEDAFNSSKIHHI